MLAAVACCPSPQWLISCGRDTVSIKKKKLKSLSDLLGQDKCSKLLQKTLKDAAKNLLKQCVALDTGQRIDPAELFLASEQPNDEPYPKAPLGHIDA